MEKIKKFVKKEIVLTISGLLAIITMFFVRPSVQYLEYIDFSTLAILFCLMAVVAGFIKSGLFEYLSDKLLKMTSNVKIIGLALSLLCFFCSMLITNDVALITFVPFTIAMLYGVSQKKLVYIIVLETICANLGSMLTPIGNPQNLYLYTFYNMSIAQFIKTVLPTSMISLAIIVLLSLLVKSEKINIAQGGKVWLDVKRLMFYLCLFVLCVATVLRLIDYRLCFLVVLIALLIFDKKVLVKVDYCLLVTFVAFFIFVGNIGQVPQISEFLQGIVNGRELGVGILASQVISNVPSAVMLSGFTQNGKELLLGVNIGGLGTIIASLASLISYKQYAQSKGADTGLFMKIFTVVNVGVLALLYLFAKL
ncbi:MAG: anion permease [Oscillospiraceae bacterium]|nr:anion permease [Oscillospiraceae bacterium]